MCYSCDAHKGNATANWSDQELDKWFTVGEWKAGWKIPCDVSVDKKRLAEYYFRNPDRWKKAFTFLMDKDLASLNPGHYELEGKDLFVIIDEYESKDEKDTRFEAHRKYIDIQYLIFGEEKIGIEILESTTEIVPYDSSKDISFFKSENNNYRVASPTKFFIFFPDDAHRPSVKNDGNIKVKKAVVKLGID